METWKVIWEVVFFGASGLFYVIALYVAVRASGDVAGFVARMLGDPPSTTDEDQ